MLVVVFDVESIGLHGETFAVGAVVVDLDKGYAVLETFKAAVHPDRAHGTKAGWEWVAKNVPGLKATHTSTNDMRTAFWEFWRRWADKGARMLADCGWPVEANFLTACVADDPGRREWQGPYPLLDLAAVLWANGVDPTTTFDRKPDELPVHDPLADARQTARVLAEQLAKRKAAVAAAAAQRAAAKPNREELMQMTAEMLQILIVGAVLAGVWWVLQ